MKDDDVNVDFAEIVEGARNQIAFITIDARSGERTIVGIVTTGSKTGRGVRVWIDGASVASRRARSARRACACSASRARERIVRLTLTTSTNSELLPLIDILIGSKSFRDASLESLTNAARSS